MKNGKEIVIKYKELVSELCDMIKARGLKDVFIIEKMEMSKPTFYRKIKDRTWTMDEVERLIEIIVRG